MRPRASITLRLGNWAMREMRNCRQVRISAPVGLFSGGTQRTALEMMASVSFRPSSGREAYWPVEKPYFARVE
jgi:hypothetical protein